MTDLATLKAALDEARAAYDAQRHAVQIAGNEARLKVHKDGEPILSELLSSVTAAKAAYEAALSASTSHPWEGRKVSRVIRVGGHWTPRTETQSGLVRVHRSGELVGAVNQKYCLPEIGQAYIVAFKKDGSPGKRVLDLARADGSFCSVWKLVKDPTQTESPNAL